MVMSWVNGLILVILVHLKYFMKTGIIIFIVKWGVPKMVVPNNHGVSLLKLIILGCFGGTHHLRKHPNGCSIFF